VRQRPDLSSAPLDAIERRVVALAGFEDQDGLWSHSSTSSVELRLATGASSRGRSFSEVLAKLVGDRGHPREIFGRYRHDSRFMVPHLSLFVDRRRSEDRSHRAPVSKRAEVRQLGRG